MIPQVAGRVLSLLNEGKIRGAARDEEDGGPAPWVLGYGTIKLNRQTPFGSAWAFRPADVAYDVVHELGQVDQASGQPGFSRFVMNVIRWASQIRGAGAAIGRDAVRFACANVAASTHS